MRAGYSRVTHPFATNQTVQAPSSSFDLHVLSTPPAFVLSQDQTLHENMKKPGKTTNNQHKLLIIRFTLPTKNWHQQTDTLLRYQATRAHRHRAASAALLGGSVRLVGDPTRRLLVLRRSARIPTVADLRGLSNSAPCGPGLAVIAVRSGCDLATRPTHRFPSGLGRQRLLGASVLRSPLGVPAFGFRVLAADRKEHYGSGGGSSNRSVHPHSPSLQHIPAGHNVVRPGGKRCIRSDVTWV